MDAINSFLASGNFKLWLGAALVPASIYIVFFIVDFIRQRLAKTMREHGVQTQALVTQLETRITWSDIDPPYPVYLVSYQFSANGETYSRRQQVQRKAYETLREGGTVPVAYLLEKPTRSRVTSSL